MNTNFVLSWTTILPNDVFCRATLLLHTTHLVSTGYGLVLSTDSFPTTAKKPTAAYLCAWHVCAIPAYYASSFWDMSRLQPYRHTTTFVLERMRSVTAPVVDGITVYYFAAWMTGRVCGA